MQLDSNLWISGCGEGGEVMTTGLFFFLVGSLSQFVPLGHSPPQVGCCWSPPCLLTLETKNRVTKEKVVRGPGQPRQTQSRSRDQQGLGGGGGEGHGSLWPSLKKNFQPHPYPWRISFAVLPRRGHLHLLSPHQAPGTVLSTLCPHSHLILAATL